MEWHQLHCINGVVMGSLREAHGPGCWQSCRV